MGVSDSKWKRFVKQKSNSELLENMKNKSWYSKKDIEVVKKEISMRKKTGKMRKDAGRKR